MKFSVSMCVYGKDDPVWFQEAVESILNQTAQPSEVVLVVDGPVPERLNGIIAAYEKNRLFRILRLPENQGHGNARRKGLEMCSNDIVALMDADDISERDRFEQQLPFFENGRTDIVGGDIAEFTGEKENVVAYRKVPETDEEIKKYMRKRCPFNQMTVMLRKSAVNSAGGYLDWYCDEDYYLWIRMAQKGCVMKNTGTILVRARVGEEMYQRRGGKRYFQSEARLQKYMLKNKIIGPGRYLVNVTERLIVQLLLPNKIRSLIFQRFARSKD